MYLGVTYAHLLVRFFGARLGRSVMGCTCAEKYQQVHRLDGRALEQGWCNFHNNLLRIGAKLA
jgi:hypothetical protein